MGKNQFVVKRNDQWAVVGANNTRATKIVDTQKKAIAIGRSIAMNQLSELRIQNSKGKFKTCNSYGNDPYPPKDKNL